MEEGGGSLRVDKVTFDYCPIEDRILARIQGSDGINRAIWVTQRLARQLVKLLCKHLEKTSLSNSGGLSPKFSSESDPKQKEMLLSFEHQAALIKQKPVPPVPAIDTDGAPLLQSLKAHLSEKRVLITIELPTGPAELALTLDQAWQLLQVILNLFRRASWPLDIWPKWMRENLRSGRSMFH